MGAGVRIELCLSLRISRERPEVPAVEQHEHRDLDTLVEHAGPQPIGFQIPTPQGVPDDRAGV